MDRAVSKAEQQTKHRSGAMMPDQPRHLLRRGLAPASLVAIGVLCGLGAASNAHSASAGQAAPAASSAAPAKTSVPHSQREELYYARRYGVGELRVHSISAGASLEFRYRVVDAVKAKGLFDNRAAAVIIARKTGTKLSGPAIEKPGTLPGAATPEVGKEYWLTFANRGKIVKPGELVDVMIGPVRISGLIVE
jgi:hypothetical protein